MMRGVIGQGANGTGDLNFAAACMAVGIPLDESLPATAIKCDTGNDYCRFFLKAVSIKGDLKLDWLQKCWSKPEAVAERAELAGFGYVMEFIKGRPDGVRRSVDWIGWAHDHLRELGESGSYLWPRKLEDVERFVRFNAETRAGYVFAFLINRDLCLFLAHQAAENPRLLSHQGKNHTMIREKAPAWRRKQFLQMIG